MTEQPDTSEAPVAEQQPQTPAAEPEAPVAPPAPPAQEEEQAPAQPPAPEEPAAAEPAAEEPAAAPAAEEPSVGPKIIGVARERTVPVVKKRLQEKPKREPLPWPELRAAVAAVKDDLDVAQLKDLFRAFPPKLRDEVIENVREFRKGARRPVSQHAAKQLARASHTARRMKRNAQPSGEVAEALGQAMAAELIASLDPEKAAEIILPKRDLLDREARQNYRRRRDEEDKERDEQRRRRREDAKSSRQQTSFGEYSGAKIKGLDELAALFGEPEAPAAEEPQAETPKAEEPKAEEPKAEEPKADEPKVEEAPAAEPAAQAPAETADEPVADEAPAPTDET